MTIENQNERKREMIKTSGIKRAKDMKRDSSEGIPGCKRLRKWLLYPLTNRRKESRMVHSIVFQHRVVRVEIYLWRFSGAPPLYINVYDEQKPRRFSLYYYRYGLRSSYIRYIGDIRYGWLLTKKTKIFFDLRYCVTISSTKLQKLKRR